MLYMVGQYDYRRQTISNYSEEEEKYSIYNKKNKDVLPWKDFNKNMLIAVEYNLLY